MTNIANSPDFVARLAAESAIRRLQATYTHRLDSGDFFGVAETLRYADLDVVGTVFSGYNAILTFIKDGLQVHADGTPRTSHTVANVLIEVDASGTKASSSSYNTVHQQVDGFPLQPICTGNYLDQFEMHDGEWRFSRRALTLRLAGDLQHHVKGQNSDVVAEHA
jgi:hypothetical protein